MLSMVLRAPVPYTMKQPLTVPEPVIEYESDADSAFAPADAADHAQVLRGAV